MLPLDPFHQFVQGIVRIVGKGVLSEGECRRIRALWLADPTISPEAIARMRQEGQL
jgi:hypothetical protein